MGRAMRWSVRMIPLVGVMGVIFYFSHQPGSALQLPDFYDSDKLFHALAYATLGSAYLLGLKPFWKEHFLPLAGSTLILCLLYGLLDEYHQSFIPGRSVSVGDVAADVCGGLVAVLSLYAGRRVFLARVGKG